MKNETALGALTCAAFALAVACSDDDSVADAAQGLCSSMDSLEATVSQVAGNGVDPDSTTVGDVQDAVASAQSQFQQAWTDALSQLNCPAPSPTS